MMMGRGDADRPGSSAKPQGLPSRARCASARKGRYLYHHTSSFTGEAGSRLCACASCRGKVRAKRQQLRNQLAEGSRVYAMPQPKPADRPSSRLTG